VKYRKNAKQLSALLRLEAMQMQPSSISCSASQTYLCHRPLFTLDTSFSPPKPDEAKGNKFKEFYLKKVLNS